MDNKGHRIFCIMGKSGTGKDTLYKKLLDDEALPFERLVPCTTRPIRAGEQNGREYHFYTIEDFRALEQAGRIIESRCYDTVYGPWYYFTADDGQIDLARHSTLLIGTLESTVSAPNPSQNTANSAVASSPTAMTFRRSALRRRVSPGVSRMMSWSGACRRSKSFCWR